MINNYSEKLAYEKFEDNKGVFRRRKSKKDITYTMGLRKGTEGQINVGTIKNGQCR